MPFWSYILTALAAYLLGSIPTGFLVAKAKGVDIRAVGSGNIGATNAMRVLGKIRFYLVAGIFVVLGHNYPCWLKFKGGKGIATTAGVYLALAPWALLAALIVFVLAFLLTRYVSIGSISAAIALVSAVWILPPHYVLLGIVTTALGALAVYKHKSNIQRLMAGTENRLGRKSQPPEEKK